MTDLKATVKPKSDQLNADDLLTGPMTITVTKVSLLAGEQPVAINFKGDDGKPYLPCKSMRRLLIYCWGSDGNAYIGRSMTLYRDEKVKFGAMEVGGIRISHMSHISEPKSTALTATRGNKKLFTVHPLKVTDTSELEKNGLNAANRGVKEYTSWLGTLKPEEKELVRGKHKEWSERARKSEPPPLAEDLSL